MYFEVYIYIVYTSRYNSMRYMYEHHDRTDPMNLYQYSSHTVKKVLIPIAVEQFALFQKFGTLGIAISSTPPVK